MASTMVAGVGLGLFIIILIWGLALLTCIMFSRTRGALSYIGGAAVVFAFLFSLILLVLPREDLDEPQTKIYDWSIIYRSCLIAGCALFLVIGVVLFLVLHLMEPVYAKPLRKLR